MTGSTTRISRSSDGGSGDGISQMGTISTNGRHVAFASGSTNLVPGDTNDRWDVFVRDLDQQRTVRVSVATDGTQGDRDAYYPSISADGRFVAFVSWATTFAPGVSSSAPRQMYLHDRDADGDGVFDETGWRHDRADQRRVHGWNRRRLRRQPTRHQRRPVCALRKRGDEPERRRQSERFEPSLSARSVDQPDDLIDRALTGGPSSWGVGYGTSDMTDDGRFITFSSISPDIVSFDMNWQSQVFRYDTVAGPTATTIVSRLPDGTARRWIELCVLGERRRPVRRVHDGGVESRVAASGCVRTGDAGRARHAATAASRGSTCSTPANRSIRRLLLHRRRQRRRHRDRPADRVRRRGWRRVHLGRIARRSSLTAFSASPASASYPIGGGSGSIEVNTTAASGWTRCVACAVDRGDGRRRFRRRPAHGAVRRQPQ